MKWRQWAGRRARVLLLVALLLVWGVVLWLGSGEGDASALLAGPSAVPASAPAPVASGAPADQ